MGPRTGNTAGLTRRIREKAMTEFLFPQILCRFLAAALLGTTILLAPTRLNAEDEAIPIADVQHEGPVDFEKEVLPILQRNCLACHNSAKSESGLVLENPQAIAKGGTEGPAVVPGKADESLLLMLAARQRESYMPPDGNDVGAKKLSSQELGLIKLWINQGAEGTVSGTRPITWQPLPPGVQPIYAVALTSDGRFAAAGRANQIFLYHVDSKRDLGRLTDPEILKSGVYQNPGVAHLDLVQSLTFSPDGERLVSGGFRTAKIWRRQRNRRAAELPGVTSAARCTAISGDGAWAAIGEESGLVQIVQLAERKVHATLTGHASPVTGVVFTADNQCVLTSSLDGTLRLWQLDGVALATIGAPGPLNDVIVLDGGKQAATAGEDHSVRLWNIVALDGALPAWNPLALAGTPDGKRVAAAAANGKAAIFDLGENKAIREWDAHAGGCTAVAWNASGDRLATIGADDLVKVWNVADGALVVEIKLDVHATAVALRHDGQQVSVGTESGEVRVADIAAPDMLKALGEPVQRISGLAYLGDGSTVVASSADGLIRKLQVADAKEVYRANHGAAVRSLAVSADGKWLATGGDDKQLKIWNAENGSAGPKPQLGGFNGAVASVAFAGAHVIGGTAEADEALAFDLASGLLVQAFRQHGGNVATLCALTADDGWRVLSAAGGGEIRSWRVRAGRQLAGHSQPVTSLAAVNDGQLISGSLDGTVRHWQLSDGKQLRELQHGGPVVDVAVQPNGARFASASSDNKAAKIWNAADGKQLHELKGDFRLTIREAEQTRSVALAKRMIDLANADLKAGNDRKTAEEGNAKKADEEKTKAQEELAKKVEAAKQPVADKEQAEKALEVAKTEAGKAEEAKKGADAELVKANEDAKAADEALKAAVAAATEAAKAAEVAATALKQAQEAAAKEPDNKELAEAAAKAQQASTEAEEQKKAADEAKTKAEQALTAAQEKVKSATEGQQNADKAVTDANNAVKQGEEKVKQTTGPAQKAIDEQTAAERTFESAMRAAERALMAVEKAAKEIPPLEEAVQTRTKEHEQAEAVLATAKQATAGGEQPFRVVAFAADNATLATTGDDQIVRVWDVDSGSPLEVLEGQGAIVRGLAFPSERQLLAVAENNSAIIWETQPQWLLERTIGAPDSTAAFVDRVTALDVSPDNKLLATGTGEPSRSGDVALWNLETGELIQRLKEPHSDEVFAVEFSRDGQYIVSSAADRFVKIFKVADGSFERAFEGHTHHVLGVSWSADGRQLASSGADKVIKIWNAQTGDQQRTIQGFGKEVTAVRYVGDTEQVVASAGDPTVQVKNATNGGNVRSLGGPADFMYAVDVSGDGTTIIAGGQDGVLRIWRQDGTVLATFGAPETQ
jgi:WD40 repeat protein